MITEVRYFDWDTRSMKKEPIKRLVVGFKTPTGVFTSEAEARDECDRNDFIFEMVTEYVVVALGEHGMATIASEEIAQANREIARLQGYIKDLQHRWNQAEVELNKYRQALYDSERG